MKVEGNFLNISRPQNGRIQDLPKADARSSARAGALQASNDGVDLGSQAGLVAATHSLGQSEASSNVQRLRALVQSGNYQVDTVALSKSIVAFAGDGF